LFVIIIELFFLTIKTTIKDVLVVQKCEVFVCDIFVKKKLYPVIDADIKQSHLIVAAICLTFWRQQRKLRCLEYSMQYFVLKSKQNSLLDGIDEKSQFMHVN